jgi:hypothetical protein
MGRGKGQGQDHNADLCTLLTATEDQGLDLDREDHREGCPSLTKHRTIRTNAAAHRRVLVMALRWVVIRMTTSGLQDGA